MPMTEDELRTALHRIPATLPPAPDRLGGIEKRVRRHRRRVAATAAASVAVVLLAVPVVRLVSERNSRDALPVTPTIQQRSDAMMKFATFVEWWDGAAFNGQLVVDPGVEGVEVTTSLPPFSCTLARMSSGEPPGTQSVWVLGDGSVLTNENPGMAGGVVAVTAAFWPEEETACDPRPRSATAFAGPPSGVTVGGSAELLFAQRLDDPSRAALDIPAVYAQIPQDRVTDHGREVYAAYTALAASLDYGTPDEQNDRVLLALGDWLSVAARSTSLSQASPQDGPVLLRASDYVGTALLPEGYSARWTTTSFCVDGSRAGSAAKHVSDTSYGEPGTPATLLDGPCPG